VAGDKNPQHCMTINKEKDYTAQYILNLKKANLFGKKMPRHT
jgi:hypothetical protein